MFISSSFGWHVYCVWCTELYHLQAWVCLFLPLIFCLFLLASFSLNALAKNFNTTLSKNGENVLGSIFPRASGGIIFSDDGQGQKASAPSQHSGG